MLNIGEPYLAVTLSYALFYPFFNLKMMLYNANVTVTLVLHYSIKWEIAAGQQQGFIIYARLRLCSYICLFIVYNIYMCINIFNVQPRVH